MEMTKVAVSEKELILQAKVGGHRAFEELIRTYQTEIYNYINKMIKNSPLAMDLLQETIVKAFKYIDKYDVQYSFRAWLYKLSKNVVIDETRRKSYKAAKMSTTMYEPHIQLSYQENDYDRMEYLSLKEALNAALNKLPENLKSIVVLCDINELSYEEAAAIENIKLGTVKSRLNRARNMIKNMKYLKEYL